MAIQKMNNMQFYIDGSQASGLILPGFTKNLALNYSLSFTKIYGMTVGNPSQEKLKQKLAISWPDILNFSLQDNMKIKNHILYFRADQTGQRLQINIEDLKPWLLLCNNIVLPYELLPLVTADSSRYYVDITKHQSKIKELPDSINLALNISTMPIDEIADLLNSCSNYIWHLFGDFSYELIAELKDLHCKIKFQTNRPLTEAMNGITYIENKPSLISSDTYQQDQLPAQIDCNCFTCSNHSRSYLHHLYKNTPVLAVQLIAIHNMTYWLH